MNVIDIISAGGSSQRPGERAVAPELPVGCPCEGSTDRPTPEKNVESTGGVR
ncbi:hypothetical protein ACFQH2_04140 [Natronoarchaeum sp. GCM10025703]|uniref:hypothetical protein n=1 Tax=unclassified Natronoarchaeum TaxID=2620183 RepID=UPI00361A7297